VTPYYSQDGITIYHADAALVLPTLSPVDLLLTDPPYGIGADRGQAARANKQHGKAVAPSRDYGVTDFWDAAPPPRWLLDQARELARWQIVFGGNYFDLPLMRCWLVWDKDNGTNDYADCELAWTNLDKAVRRLTFRWQGMLTAPGCPKEDRVHPTQKPEPVMRWALMQAPPDVRTVLDPFMGSGTTLVACKRLGRECIGIEREERYCEAAARRLSQGALPLEMGA
jgi:DNA modification methylase